MKFFVPYLDESKGEQLWSEVRAVLGEIGLPTTERRIQALTLGNGRSGHVLAVGMSVSDCDEPILLILEADGIDIYYACTSSNGVDEGVPFPLGLTPHGCAIDFDPPIPRRLH
ncbi:MAG TPA: hypothetical protein VF603_01740 [Allosphingosinicella sp.]|jgi:hypothetical protein